MNLKVSERDESLSVALSVKERLQSALSSSKHGVSGEHGKGAALDVRTLLRGNSMNVSTVAIDYGTSKQLVLFKWYSMCTVLLREIVQSMERRGDTYMIHLDPDKMALYSTDPGSAVQGLLQSLRGKYHIVADGTSLVAQSLPPDILTRQIRCTRLNCRESDWDVTDEGGVVYTVFKGEHFDEVVGSASEVLSTNVDVTVSRLGRVRSMLLYRRHLRGESVDQYLANIFCSFSDRCNVYSNIARGDPVKRVSIKDQVGTLVSSSLARRVDTLSSAEAKFMVGAKLEGGDF